MGESRTGMREARGATRISSPARRLPPERFEERRRFCGRGRNLACRAGAAQAKHDIERIYHRAAQPDCFAQHAFEPVPVNGTPQIAATDYIPHPTHRTDRGSRNELKSLAFESLPAAEHRGKLRGAAQPVATGQPEKRA
jgi:hypothetical protein